MTIQSNIDRVFGRLQKRIEDAQPDNPVLRAAYARIGILISSQATINARRQGIIDTGRLLNSIRYEYFTEGTINGIRVGSFGVPYAAKNEYGGPVTRQQMKAMFANLAKRGKKLRGRNKKVIVNGNWRARPFLSTAVKSQTNLIINILREALLGG
jgi:hypothetical protein